jgi:hypothetical protein
MNQMPLAYNKGQVFVSVSNYGKPLHPGDQETTQRCGIPAVSGYCTSNRKDTEHGECKGK